MIESKFEPYQLNGGLVSGVAGKDYVLIASDTRLSNGYEILSRNHVSSRLWSVVGGSIGASSSVDDTNLSFLSSTASSRGRGGLLPGSSSSSSTTLIGSSGCAADCIALRRRVRSEIKATGSRLTPKQVSVLLGNTLYHRRSFPFYSFCVVAGLHQENDDDDDRNTGEIYVYDAIGSHERVAVAAVGTGREMMQPILDRLFSTTTPTTPTSHEPSTPSTQNEDDDRDDAENYHRSHPPSDILLRPRDSNAVTFAEQQRGNSLIPPVKTHVDCECEEAISLLVRGYRSVAEREIGLGDKIVVCVLKRRTHRENDADTYTSMETRTFALKMH